MSQTPSPCTVRYAWAQLFLGAAALLVSGCALGPDFKRPQIDMPSGYRTAAGAEAGATENPSFADLPWWQLFRDPVLQALIEEALRNSYDMKIVAARVEQARYAVGQTRADLMPQVGYEGSATRGRFFSPSGQNLTRNQFLGAFQMAWEIDLWGRIRRATEASLANLLAAEDSRRGLILSLVAGVAQSYLELRELDLEREIALRTRASFQETLDLFTRQLVGGVGNKLATSRASAALSGTLATIPDIERLIVEKENQISVLLGRRPGPISRGAVLGGQVMPPEVPTGLPIGLLERRPDILQAEQAIAAANALVGVSVTNFLPRVGLSALYGGQSTEVENLVKGPGALWSIAAGVTGPLFQGGRLYSSYKGSVAAWEEARYSYEQTVLKALAEVSNALVARDKFAESRVELEQQVTALQSAVRLSTLRFTGGLANYYEVLESQQQLFPAEIARARTGLNELLSVVQLYRALGGGWRAEEERHPERYPIRRDALDRTIPGQGRRDHPRGTESAATD